MSVSYTEFEVSVSASYTAYHLSVENGNHLVVALEMGCRLFGSLEQGEGDYDVFENILDSFEKMGNLKESV